MTRESKEDELTVTVIMIGFNGRRYLHGSLASVLDQEMPAGSYDVVYVDNASADGSADLVEREFPDVRIARMPHNLGFYGGFNWAAAHLARGRLLVAAPQDVVVHRRWLTELVKAADSDERVVKCVTNTVPSGSPDFAAKDREGLPSTVTRTTVSRLGYVRVATRLFDPRPTPTLASAGASGLVKRALFERSGHYYDDALSHYAGDAECALRVFVLGGVTLHVPTAIVYHVGEQERTLTDRRLLLRYAAGSCDAVLAYYKNMTGLEFALFAPFLLVGLALKPLALRAPLAMRLALVVAALPLAPFVFAAALLRLDRVSTTRRRVLRERSVGSFGLLLAVLGRSAVPPDAETQRAPVTTL